MFLTLLKSFGSPKPDASNTETSIESPAQLPVPYWVLQDVIWSSAGFDFEVLVNVSVADEVVVAGVGVVGAGVVGAGEEAWVVDGNVVVVVDVVVCVDVSVDPPVEVGGEVVKPSLQISVRQSVQLGSFPRRTFVRAVLSVFIEDKMTRRGLGS